MNTAPGVCVLGWVECRSLLVILCIIMYVYKKIKKTDIFFLQNR